MDDDGARHYPLGNAGTVDRTFSWFQIWLNLPSEHKMIEPAYHDLEASSLNSFETDGGTIKLIAGSLAVNEARYLAEYQSEERTRPAIARST